jgi:DNA-binding response OmpR family regulator
VGDELDRVLIIDDEPRLASFVSRALRSRGYVTDCALDGPGALRMAASRRYDLVVLDLLLPGLHGEQVLSHLLHLNPRLPVIILSAVDEVQSKVRCLDGGAVDYLSKPFALSELVARVRARTRAAPAEQPVGIRSLDRPRSVRVGTRPGAMRLDLDRRVVEISGTTVALSTREFLLLRALVEAEGAVCTREELLAGVWGYGHDPGSNVVEVYVGRLRGKLGNDVIETVRGVGYRIE